ncbi:MAG: hypothetical protein ABIJ47_02095 [Candidatus Bathyarchaeota archaeon]
MAPLLDAETLLNVALMIILCIGFTFTYMMEGFPNFAHTGYASIGALVSFYLARIIGLNPYLTWPFSALAGSIITIHRGVGIEGTEGLIVNVMSGAVLGGLYSIYGAIIGGIFIALAENTLKNLFFIFFGLAAETWKGLLPLIFLLTATAFFPNGLTGSRDLNVRSLLRRVLRVIDFGED